jgi:hypothetical protein
MRSTINRLLGKLCHAPAEQSALEEPAHVEGNIDLDVSQSGEYIPAESD